MGTDRELKYKVIKEYKYYYLTKNEKHGYKECFDKVFYKPGMNGYITIKIKEYEAREPLDPSKINKLWNWRVKGK